MNKLTKKYPKREIDILVSERIFGIAVQETKSLWKTSDVRGSYNITELVASGQGLPEYSSDLAYGIEIVSEMNKMGFYLGSLYQLKVYQPKDDRWCAEFEYFGNAHDEYQKYSAIGNNPSEALCIAGLEVVQNFA